MSYSDNYWREQQPQKPGFNGSTKVQRQPGRSGAFDQPPPMFQRPGRNPSSSRARTPGPRSVSAHRRGPGDLQQGPGGYGSNTARLRASSVAGRERSLHPHHHQQQQQQQQGYYPPSHPQHHAHPQTGYEQQHFRMGSPDEDSLFYQDDSYTGDEGGYGMMPVAQSGQGRRFGHGGPLPAPRQQGQSDEAVRAQLASITQLTQTIAQHLDIQPGGQPPPPPQQQRQQQYGDHVSTPSTSAPTSQRSRAFVVPRPQQQQQQQQHQPQQNVSFTQHQLVTPGYPSPPGRAQGQGAESGAPSSELKKEEVERIVRRVESHFVTKLDESKKVIDQQLQIIEAIKKKRDEEKRHYTSRIQTLERQLKMQLDDTDAAVGAVVTASTPTHNSGSDGSAVNTPKRGGADSDVGELRRQLQAERRQRLELEEQSHNLVENHAKLMETMEERLKQKDRLVGELAATAVAARENNNSSGAGGANAGSTIRGVTPRSARPSGRLGAPPTPTNTMSGSFSTPTPHRIMAGSATKGGGPEVPPIRGLGGYTQRTALQNAALMPPPTTAASRVSGGYFSASPEHESERTTTTFDMSPPERDSVRHGSQGGSSRRSLPHRNHHDEEEDEISIEEVSPNGGLGRTTPTTAGGVAHRSVSEGVATEVVRMSAGTSTSNASFLHHQKKQQGRESSVATSTGFSEHRAEESALEVMQLLSTIDAELDTISAM